MSASQTVKKEYQLCRVSAREQRSAKTPFSKDFTSNQRLDRETGDLDRRSATKGYPSAIEVALPIPKPIASYEISTTTKTTRSHRKILACSNGINPFHKILRRRVPSR